MSDALSPNANLALLQAAQTDHTGAAQALKNAAKAREIQKIENTARDFEAVFISEMMKPMFEGLSTEAPFGGGKGEEVFRGMMLQEYGKIIAETGGLGIADQVKDQMIQMQQQADNASTLNPGTLAHNATHNTTQDGVIEHE